MFLVNLGHGSRKRGVCMRAYLYIIATAAGGLFTATEAALAGFVAPIPGPIVGAGAPALLVIAGAFWLVRRIRDRHKT